MHAEVNKKNNLSVIYFDSYNGLYLGEKTYENIICTNPILFYYDYQFASIRAPENRFNHFASIVAGGKYYEKYIKYKLKYMKLKNK
jgi:hypothetical protein